MQQQPACSAFALRWVTQCCEALVCFHVNLHICGCIYIASVQARMCVFVRKKECRGGGALSSCLPQCEPPQWVGEATDSPGSVPLLDAGSIHLPEIFSSLLQSSAAPLTVAPLPCRIYLLCLVRLICALSLSFSLVLILSLSPSTSSDQQQRTKTKLNLQTLVLNIRLTGCILKAGI